MLVCPITSVKNMDIELGLALKTRPDLLEFRTDLLPLEKLDEVSAFAKEKGFGIVLTIKDLALPSNRELVQKADLGGGSYIDLDYAELRNDVSIAQLCKSLAPRHANLVISHHIFEEDRKSQSRVPNASVPNAMDREGCQTCEEMMDVLEDFRSDIISGFCFRNKVLIKFAYHVCDEAEAEVFCRLASGRKDFIAVPMGEFGKRFRLKLYSRNPLSYAYLCVPNAPGQPSIEEYRMV